MPPDPTDGMRDYGIANLDFKRVAGGLLVENLDDLGLDRGQLQVVTQRRPTLEELTDLLFAWRAVRHVRSNAIVLARNGATVGIGAGQASRQVSVEIALRRAGDRAKTAVMASDAYFPFPDGIQAAAGAGRHGDHPAGRLDPRRDGDRGRRPPSPGDGLHRPTALPALSAAHRPGTDGTAARARDGPRHRGGRASSRRGSWAAASGRGRRGRDRGDARDDGRDRVRRPHRHRRGRARRGADALHRRAGRADRRRAAPTCPAIDIAVDPLEGTNLVAHGQAGAITVLAASEAGGLIHAPDTYMEKLCVGPVAAGKVDIRGQPDREPRAHRRGARPQGQRHHGRHPRAAAPRRPHRRGPRRRAPGSSSSATATCRPPSRARCRAPASTP